MKHLFVCALILLAVAPAFALDTGGQFAVAIEKGDLATIQKLIRGGAAADTPIVYGEHKITPLMKACWDGQTEIVSFLLSAGANINAADEQGDTPLTNAVKRERVELAQMLIEKGAKVNIKDTREFTPIAIAAAAGDLEMVEALAKGGAVLTTETYGLTPLSFAASAGNVDMVRLLVKLGLPVNYASKTGDPGTTALITAVYSGKIEVVKALIELKANVNVKTKSGDTPMKAAQKGDQTEMIALLKSAGAKGGDTAPTAAAPPKSGVKAEAESSATAAADAQRMEQARSTLKKRGVDLNALEAKLWEAVEKGDAETAQLLVDAGANVNQKGSYGETMTLRAAGSGKLEVLESLIRGGADVNLENEYKMAPLAVAAEQGHKEIVEALLRAGANVNARNTYGGTALQVAVLRGYTELVRTLITAGADVQRDRKELLEIAQREKHPDIEKMIREAPAKPKK